VAQQLPFLGPLEVNKGLAQPCWVASLRLGGRCSGSAASGSRAARLGHHSSPEVRATGPTIRVWQPPKRPGGTRPYKLWLGPVAGTFATDAV